jgi:hypothetical protein
MKLVMGVFNAQFGRDNNAWEETMGKAAIGDRTDSGERLLSYCSSNKLKIGGSSSTRTFIKAHGDLRMERLPTRLITYAFQEDGLHRCRMYGSTEEQMLIQITTLL